MLKEIGNNQQKISVTVEPNVMPEFGDMLNKYKESETQYDSQGNVLESVTYKLGKVDKHFKYQYDQDNNKIKEDLEDDWQSS